MELSLKEKILLGFIGATLIFSIGGSAWALVSPKDKTSEQATSQVSESRQSSEIGSNKKEDAVSTTSDSEDTEPSDSSPATSPEPSAATADSPSASSSIPSTTTKPSTPQRATPAPKPSQPQPKAETCNQSMKASYKGLYDSQVSAEKADWARRVNQWGNEASANGGSFSGYVQGKINANKPAHDARLTQLQATYQQNLVSIHCN